MSGYWWTWWAVVVVVFGVTVGSQPQDYPCKLVEGDLEYDLSELAARDHWQVREIVSAHGQDNERLFYVSVCHPLRGVPQQCAGNATAVCAVKTTGENIGQVDIANVGKVSLKGPTLSPWFSTLEYKLEGGDACPYPGADKYSTSITLMCAKAPSQENELQVMYFKQCHLVIAWLTTAACPRRLVVNSTCSVQFPTSNHMLHLQTLRAPLHYSLASYRPQAKYEVNVCGPVVNGSCGGQNTSVCRIPEGGPPEALATMSGMKLAWEGDVLVLSYPSVGQGQGVEMSFVCDRTAVDAKMAYVKQNDTTVTLGARTSAVCPPDSQVQCVVTDRAGNVYDLRPLHKNTGNWEVVQSSDEGPVLYHLNMCGPVNHDISYSCPVGLIGACQTRVRSKTSYNLGLLNGDPVINTKDGSITVMYHGGDPCNGGNNSHSTQINLICNNDEHGPSLVKESNTCDYVFDWLTPVACPRHLTTGTDCKVQDPLYKNIYDLNPLRNPHTDYKVGEEFFINLCGPLVLPCADKAPSGVCQSSGGEKFSAGLATSNLTFNDGTLMMKYTNGSSNCPGNNTRSSQIIFVCDHEASGRDGPIILNEELCLTIFFWRTKLACPPFTVVDCTVHTPDGTMYDLRELSSSTTNLESYTFDGSKKFVLNVCRSVVHQKSSRCPYRAAACIIDRTHQNQSQNIGEVQSSPFVEGGRLLLSYVGGEQCEEHSQPYQTLIEFKCDKDVTFPQPRLINVENCTYYFELRTSVACPLSVKNGTFPSIGGDCTVTSPSGYVFNLTSLKKETGYKVRGGKSLRLTLNVCAAVGSQLCTKEGTGACNNGVSAGQANANLIYRPGHLFLHYSDGTQCNSSTKRSTYITFVCGAENVTEGPVLVHDDQAQCVYLITWFTELACERRIPCYVDTWESRIDLSPLIKSSGNYEAVNQGNPKEKFYLNVCRPLNPIIGLNCRPGSAGCVSSPESEDPLSLGHPIVMPVSNYNKGAIIMYTHGSQCPSRTNYSLTSKISFVCDINAGKGNPVFLEKTHDCQYQFEWRTSVACIGQLDEKDLGPQCQIRFDDAKTNIDLKPLHRPGGYRVRYREKTFVVNVCGPACNGTSGSCTSEGDSYGLSNKAKLKWENDFLSLNYSGGSQCDGTHIGNKSTSILFECDMTAGFGQPAAKEMGEPVCNAIFTWKTNVTCIQGIYGTEETHTATTDHPTRDRNASGEAQKSKTSEAHSTVYTVIASVMVVSGIIFVVVLVLLKSRRGNHIVASTRRLFGIRGPTTLLLDDVS